MNMPNEVEGMKKGNGFGIRITYHSVMERMSRTTKSKSINQVVGQESAPESPRIQSRCPSQTFEFSAQSV